MLPILRSRLWSPVARFESPRDSLLGDMDQWLNRLFHDARRGGPAFEPSLDVEDDEKEVRIRVEIPGVGAKDLHVELHDRVLTIRGEKKDEHEGKDGGRQWSERVYGSFARRISVPAYVDAEKIQATYRDGILSLSLPKTEQAKPKQIEVKSA